MDTQVGKVFKHRQLKKPLNPEQKKLQLIYIMVLVALCVPNYFNKLHGDYSLQNFSHVCTLEVINILGFIGAVVVIFVVSETLFRIRNFLMLEEIGVTPKEVFRKTLFGHQKIPMSDIRLVKNRSDAYAWLIIKTDKTEFNWGKTFYSSEVNAVVAYILEQIRIHYPEKYEDVRTEHFEIESFWRN